MDAFRKGRSTIARVRHSLEQIVNMLCTIEAHNSSGMAQEQVPCKNEVSVQTYYCWRKEYGGLKVDQAKCLKEIEKESACFTRLVA